MKYAFDSIVCIFLSSLEKSFDEVLREELKRRLSFLLDVEEVSFFDDKTLIFYAKISFADRERFNDSLKLVVDDLLLDRMFFKVFVIFCSRHCQELGDRLLDVFFFLYKQRLISFSGYFNFYTDKFIKESYENYLSLRKKVVEALDFWRGGIEIFVQPIFRAGDGNGAGTEVVFYGYEVLSRLVDLKTGDLIYPRQYFEVLYREPELSTVFQEKVLRKVVEPLPLNIPCKIHCNFTLDFLRDNYGLLTFLKEKKRLDFLVIEVVEYNERMFSSFLIGDENLKVLRKLQSNGYPVVFDDVSEGLNNLTTLLDFQPDGLKVSKKMLSGLRDICNFEGFGEKGAKVHLLSGFCDVLKRFKSESSIPLFVEGIETVDDLILSKNLIGADYYQGFYLGKPVKLEPAQLLNK